MSEYGIMTDDIIKQSKECPQRKRGCGSGDSGEAKCIFCPHCVLSAHEIYINIRHERGPIVPMFD